MSAASTVMAKFSSFIQTGGTANLGALSGLGNPQIGNNSGASAVTTVTSVSGAIVLSILATGKVTLLSNSPGPNSLNGLSIAPGGVFDITNNHLIVNYGGIQSIHIDPVVDFEACNSGTWTSGAYVQHRAKQRRQLWHRLRRLG